MASRAMLSLLLLSLTLISASSELVLEEGYVVSTVVDFNKLSPSGGAVNPFSLLPRPRSQDLLLLDSSGSVFYSLPLRLPLSEGKEGEVRKLSGKGVSGFSDGDPAAAMFDRPRSFAIDAADNVYVADRNNHAIRKISKSGVTTTIAGGYSGKTGKVDGPAQNASFSSDFELVYVPKICALLITDRGNRLIRQVNLKPNDCTQESQSGLGVSSVSAIAVLCALFGSVLGFMARHLLAFHGVYNNHCVSKTWKHYQTNLGRVALMTFSGVRSAIANSTLYAILFKLVKSMLGYLSVMFYSVRLERHFQCKQTVSLLDSDVTNNVNCFEKVPISADLLKDLISFDEGIEALKVSRSSGEEGEVMDASQGNSMKMDHMIRTNMLDFANQQSPTEDSNIINPGLIRRRTNSLLR